MANKTVFNNYSDSLAKSVEDRIDQLGGTVILQLTTGKKLHVPGRAPGTWEYKQLFNATFSLPARDRVRDGKDTINLGVITEFDGDGNPTFDNYWFKPEETEGAFILRKANHREYEWLKHILLGNYAENGVNPERDKTKAICKIIDREADGVEAMEKFTVEQSAFLTAMGMDETKIREYAAAMGWNERESFSILRPQVINQAKADPVFFNKFVDGNGIEYRAILKQAMTANLVNYEETTNEIRWANGETLADLSRKEGKDYLDKWATWVLAHPKGNDTITTLKELLAPKKKK